MKTSVAAVSLIALLSGTAQAADGPHVFKPSSVWAADFGENYCRLTRDFSDGKDTVSIVMDRIQPGNAMRVLVVGDPIKLFRSAERLGYQYLPAGDERMATPVKGEMGKGPPYYNLGDILIGPLPKLPAPGTPPAPPAPYTRDGELEFAAGIKGLALTKGMVNPINIETGSLKEPIRIEQKCIDDLLTHWGLDAEKHKSLTRPAFPASDTRTWLPGDTIGFSDFNKLAVSNNQFRVLVDASGKPTSCEVHWPTLGESKNALICKTVMEKGKFLPALDAGGQAIASYSMLSPYFFMAPFGGT